MRVLITGASGFTGRFLAQNLLDSGHEVHGLSANADATTNTVLTGNHRCDLLKFDSLCRIMQLVRPEAIVHLAGISNVAHGDAEDMYRGNLFATRNLLESLLERGSTIKAVLLPSSAYVYGNKKEGILDELSPFDPVNDYAVSKLAMEYMAGLYGDCLPITIVRPFNYTGIGQSLSFLLPKIVDFIKRKAPIIELGNLEVARDFSDVRMVVQYYQKLLEASNVSGEVFNVCSGRAYTLQEVLKMARHISGHNFEVRVNPAFVRLNEVKILVGNKDKLDKAVGKIDGFSLEETLRWMIEA
jgi:GDP-6-deoxy-D-talose 4-dehydrogenase